MSKSLITIFYFCLFSTRWQKIEEMHDLKDNRLKIIKEGIKKTAKQPTNESDDEEDLEKELQSMYNWRQKRS